MVTALFVGVCVALAAVELSGGWPGVLIASGLTSFLALGVIAWGMLGAWDRVLYLWITSAFYFVGFSLNAFLLAGGWARVQALLPGDYESVALSFRIGTLGWICWIAGFLSCSSRGSRRMADDRQPRGRRQIPPFALLAVAAVGLVGKVVVGLFIHSSAGGELFSKVGTFFSILAVFGLMAVCVLFDAGNWRQRALALFLMAAWAGSGLLTGQRAEAVKGVVAFLLFVMLRRKRAGRPIRRQMAVVVAFLLAFVLLYPAMSSLKAAMGRERADKGGAERARLLVDALQRVETADEATAAESLTRLLLRMSQVQYGAHLVTTGLGQWGPLRGRSLYEVAIMFVPRAVWREKPVIGLGPEAYALLGFAEGTGSTTVPISAEWYLNFAWAGVVGGMFAVGFIVASVHGRLGRGEALRNAALAVMALEVCQAGTGLKGIASALALYGGGAVVLEWFLYRRGRSIPAATPGAMPARGAARP